MYDVSLIINAGKTCKDNVDKVEPCPNKGNIKFCSTITKNSVSLQKKIMPITYRQRDEIDTKKWNTCVESNGETANLSAMSWYLDACCTDWDALVFDDYRAVIPLPCRKKFGIKYVYPPFFAPRLGFFGEKLMPKEVDNALNFIAKKFKWVDMIFTSDIRYKKGNTFLHKTYILNLNTDYEIIKKKYHENHLRNCKKGQVENLKLIFDTPTETIIDLFKNNRGKDDAVGYKFQDYSDLLNIISLLQEQKSVEVVGVQNSEGVLCAGAFFTYRFGKYHFLFSGRNTDKQSRSLYFLIDNFLFRHAGEDMILDFNGSNNPNIARFYAGFGAKEEYAHQLTIENFNPFAKKVHSIYKKFRF